MALDVEAPVSADAAASLSAPPLHDVIRAGRTASIAMRSFIERVVRRGIRRPRLDAGGDDSNWSTFSARLRDSDYGALARGACLRPTYEHRGTPAGRMRGRLFSDASAALVVTPTNRRG